MKNFVFTLFLLWILVPVHAQELSDTLGVTVYFQQGSSVLDASFRDNGKCLTTFINEVSALQKNPQYRLRSIRITSGASPEGNSTLNKELSEARALSLRTYLSRHLDPADYHYTIKSLGVDWEGLAELVKVSNMPYKNEVLNILYNTPEWEIRDGVVVDERKKQLIDLRGGRSWWYMYEHFFPQLRGSGTQVACEIERIANPAGSQRDTIWISNRDTIVVQITDTTTLLSKTTSKPFFMAVKTNLLYDALLVPNIGIEFYLGKGWSIGANWMYAWWKINRKHYFWRTYGGEIEVRKYLGRRAEEKPLSGHHIGLYGQMLTYDFETGGKGYLGDRWNYGIGLSYGYSHPISRRLNLDFTIGVGYLGGEYQVYTPVDNCYVWKETKHRNWVGPTKVEISLVWLLGHGNYNKMKGSAK